MPPIPPRESRLRYFLDGAQRTFAVWRCGLVPTAATVVAAGILQRDPGEDGSVVPGTLRMEHCWLIPRDTGDPRVDELLRRIDEEGMRVVDPRGLGGSRRTTLPRDRFPVRTTPRSTTAACTSWRMSPPARCARRSRRAC